MVAKLEKFVIHTTKYVDYINITKQVEEIVERSGIQEGIVHVITMHTTTGIMLNESLECLQSDMEVMMNRLVPEFDTYAHSRMLHSYGTTAGNPTGHLRSMLTGSQISLPIEDGKIYRGGAQEIFFCEYDGAQSRTVCVEMIGEA